MTTSRNNKKPAETRRAIIYARISEDRRGDSEAPERQIESCRQYCLARGWTVVEPPLVDRDKSAYKKDVKRPSFDKALKMVRNGEANAIVFWRLDRFTRRVSQLTKIADEFKDDKLDVALVSTQQMIDTSTDMGRLFATIVSAIAQMESEAIKERLVAKNEYDAEKGRYVKGGIRAFGRNLDGSFVDAEVGAIKEVARRYIEGETLGTLARWLNYENILTPRGNTWSSSTVSRMLREPHVRGARSYRGEEFPGAFEAILDEWTITEVTDKLKSKGAGSIKWGGDHLLTGFVRCGICGNRMTCSSHKKNGIRYEKYACRGDDSQGHCGRIVVSMGHADNEVSRRVVAKLIEEQGRDPRSGGEIDEEMAQLQAQVTNDLHSLDELRNERYVERTVETEDYQRIRAELQDRITINDERISRLARQLDARRIVVDKDPKGTWESKTLAQKKIVMRRLLTTIRVKPIGKGGGAFQPERIDVDWIEDEDEEDMA